MAKRLKVKQEIRAITRAKKSVKAIIKQIIAYKL